MRFCVLVVEEEVLEVQRVHGAFSANVDRAEEGSSCVEGEPEPEKGEATVELLAGEDTVPVAVHAIKGPKKVLRMTSCVVLFFENLAQHLLRAADTRIRSLQTGARGAVGARHGVWKVPGRIRYVVLAVWNGKQNSTRGPLHFGR